MNLPGDWQPAASRAILQQRAQLLHIFREFFGERKILEVETPALLSAVAPEAHLRHFTVSASQNSAAVQWLCASPEAAMKRLLAAGSGPIYQICRVFRDGEQGLRHNPEFTMLEWYRPHCRESFMMEETRELITAVIGEWPVEYHTYGDLFAAYIGLDPHDAPVAKLQAALPDDEDFSAAAREALHDRATLLEFLFSRCVEPQLGQKRLVFVHDYPKEQAVFTALKQNKDGFTVACRFELYINGMELANGGRELCDSEELMRRFIEEQRCQEDAAKPVDRHLIAALSEEMLPCAGVALGVDRLLMIVAQCRSIQEVLAFPPDRI